MFLSKIGHVKAVIHRPLEGTVKTATVRKSATGKWFVCLSCEVKPQPLPQSTTEAVGVDVGLKSIIATSDGGSVPAPKFLRKEEKELARTQRRLCPEEHRTASERIAMLDLDGLDGASTLAIQTHHDEAFAVKPVTNEFFREYARVESLVEGIAEDATERRHLFTQRLFNRLMFTAFIQKKGWLRFDGDANYLPALWRAYRHDEHDENFYRDRLKLLFFTGLNTLNEVDVAGINDGGYTSEVFGDVPYLNGGLFERNEDDNDDAIAVPDAAIETILEDLFGRFNFTVTESTPLDVEVQARRRHHPRHEHHRLRRSASLPERDRVPHDLHRPEGEQRDRRSHHPHPGEIPRSTLS